MTWPEVRVTERTETSSYGQHSHGATVHWLYLQRPDGLPLTRISTNNPAGVAIACGVAEWRERRRWPTRGEGAAHGEGPDGVVSGVVGSRGCAVQELRGGPEAGDGRGPLLLRLPVVRPRCPDARRSRGARGFPGGAPVARPGGRGSRGGPARGGYGRSVASVASVAGAGETPR